tara:strand:- start:1352 stop:1603 length:252 start_codon:yes stop_codon:yes gene_type:complete
MMGALNKQVGSDHYKTLGIQPLESTLANFGYAGLRATIYNKVNKYLLREKGSHVQDIEKAIHCLEIQLEAAKTEELKTQIEST